MGILDFFKRRNTKDAAATPTFQGEFSKLLNQLELEARAIYPHMYSAVKFNDLESYAEIKGLNNNDKFKCFKESIELVNTVAKKLQDSKRTDNYKREANLNFTKYFYLKLSATLMRFKLNLSDEDFIYIFNAYKKSLDNEIHFFEWPLGHTAIQLEKHVKLNGLSDNLSNFLKDLLTWKVFLNASKHWGADTKKVKLKIEKLLNEESGNHEVSPVTWQDDQLGNKINSDVSDLPQEQQSNWHRLFHLSLEAKQGKPTKKYLTHFNEIVDEIGASAYKVMMHNWLQFYNEMKEEITTYQSQYGGRVYEYSNFTFLKEQNSVSWKGMIWGMQRFHDTTSLQLLAQSVERSNKTVPGHGPVAAIIGNAGIYVLGASKGLDGISHLSRLQLRIKQKNTKNLINRYIQDSAKLKGVSIEAIGDLSVPSYKLTNGARTESFEDYTCKLSIEGIGKTSLTWLKPDGKTQKTTPSFVKNSAKLSDKLKRLKQDNALIKKTLTAQRDRIDRSYISNREWDRESFENHYLNHGLMSFITRKLIWDIEQNGNILSVFWQDAKWQTREGREVVIEQDAKITLWHPIFSSEEEIVSWREFMLTNEIVQPMKQAFREIYLLTDAEINTKTYSNRMAAHLVKQHQFSALASLRNWSYTNLGAFDHGLEGKAKIDLPQHQLIAEYWINELYDSNAITEAGMWMYIATDQVRFLNERREILELESIPKLVFSEIMRDVDLFVGVASVGNDPQWQDRGGVTGYRDYWQSYSFGDLNEQAKTRAIVLERLIPRLKYKDQLSIDGRFVKVKGTKRNYKIHIGSTNILMEPDDQYLCIVPDNKRNRSTNLFLPFEGDKGLSLILSKIFLLAEDDKITDRTILSQINR